MLHTMKRGFLVGAVVAIIAALCSASAMAAHGHGKFGLRASAGYGVDGGFGPFAGMRGFGGMPGFAGAMFGMGGFGLGGPGFGHHGPGHGAGGAGLLAGEVLKTAASYLGIPLATLQADLKSGKTLAEEATAKGKDPKDLIQKLTDAAKSNLDAAVAAGWLTEAQATRLLDASTKAITDLVNNGPAVPPGAKAGPLDTAAKFLGMTVSELKEALKGGKSLAQIAGDKKLSVADLVSALTADVKKRLDAAVADNDITQAQATAILNRLTERVTDWVNGVKGPKAASATTTNAIKHALRFIVRR
jgi:hypothetical protein